MRKYEILLLLNPELKSDEITNTLNWLEKILDPKIVKKEDWGIRELAYEIKKQKKAYYYLYYLESEPENIIRLKKEILIKKNILRNIILVHDKKWPFEMKTTKKLVLRDKKSSFKNRDRNREKQNDQ